MSTSNKDFTLNKKTIGLKISLRSKIIALQTFVSLIIVLGILAVTTSMVFEDKAAYIYDTVYSNIKSYNLVLERFFKSKDKFSKATQLGFKKSEFISYGKNAFSMDPDLYMVISIKNQDHSILYKNEKREILYRKDKSFLEQDLSDKISLNNQKDDSDLIYNKGKMPFYVVKLYDSELDSYYIFSYFLDNIFQEVLNNPMYENTIINHEGEVIYKNKPYLFERQLVSYYKKVLDSLDEQKNGIKEIERHDGMSVTGYHQITRLKNFYVMSEIQNKKAYIVTKVLAYKTFTYALILIGFLNLITLFLSKSITNPMDSLLSGIKKISNGSYEYKIRIETNDEFRDLAHSFNIMGDKIIEYNDKLKEYNRTLEEKVVERTKELNNANLFINTMINSLDQGLLVFNILGKCLQTFTKPCIDFFKTSPAGKHIADLINPQDKNTFLEWMNALFQEPIPFKSLVELGPKYLPNETSQNDDEYKHISLNYYPMRDKNKKISNIVVVATDNTKEFKANQKIQEQKDFISFLGTAIPQQENYFSLVNTFFKNSEKYNQLSDQDLITPKTKEDILMFLHSLKGGFGLFKMNKLVNIIHEYESYLQNHSLDKVKLQDEFKKIQQELESKTHEIRKLVSDTSEIKKVDPSAIDDFKSYLIKNSSNELIKKFEMMFKLRPVSSFLDDYVKMMKDLAPSLGKEINEIHITGNKTLINHENFESFFASCVHLFRNALDHGIETPLKRQELGKTSGGNFQIKCESINNEFIFELTDDGGGINPEKLKAKMKSLGYKEEDLIKNDKDIIYHIFDIELSTAEKISEISGRGVGLSDVKQCVEKLNGRINLTTKENYGTTFKFIFPIT